MFERYRWEKVLKAMEQMQDMEKVSRLAERAARHDRRCTKVSLYGDYLEVDYEPRNARFEAMRYLGRMLSDGYIDAPMWARLSQMLATAELWEKVE